MRKKLFAVIMSAMMMITFMPTMAFATVDANATVNWSDNYSKLTVTLSTGETATLDASRTFDTTTNKGLITATVPTVTDTTLEDYGYSATAVTNLKDTFNANLTKKFYDLTNAKIWYETATSGTYAILGTTVDASVFASLVATPSKFHGLKLVRPSYFTDAEKAVSTVTEVKATATELGTVGLDVELPTADDLGYKESAQDQPVTLPVYAEINATGITAGLVVEGTISQELTVKGTKPVVGNAKFYVDAEQTENALTMSTDNFSKTLTYDGAEHEIVMSKLDGVTISSLEKFNWKTGAYEKVDSMKVKDATKTARPNKYKAVIKDANKGVRTCTIEVGVEAAKIIAYVPGTLEVYAGSDVTVENALTFEENYTPYATAAQEKAVRATIKAEKKAMKEWINKYYDITIEKEFANTYVTVAKKADAPDLTLDANKYSANVDLTVDEDTSDVNVKTVINVVTASNQTKTFHVKNAGKLKSNKTFKLKGDNTVYGELSFVKKSGNSKIKVAKNGKVTVKKGLKKGTYKVKVRVIAAGAFDTKTLKVKVVK